MKLKEILNMEHYLAKECYCPGEIYSADGFFYRIFDKEDECTMLGKQEKENKFTKEGYSFISVVAQHKEESPQVLMILYETGKDKIADIIRFDATENNIKYVKEVIETGTSDLKWDHYNKEEKIKSLKEIMSIADAICIS